MTVFVGSRWHVDDPAGRFLKAAAESKENPQWNVICLPALLDAEAYVDDVWNLGLDGPLPDWRAQGEALWPEKFSRQFLEQQRMDPVTWAALWQQRPLLAENRKLDCLWFERNAIAPDDPLLARVMWWVRAVDLAVSETTHADHTAGVLVGLTDTGHLVLKHVYRFKREWTEARREILAFARVDGSTVELAFGAGGAMRGIVTRLRDEDAEFRPFRVHLVEEVGGKLTRAMEWAPLAAAGRVKMVKGGWNEAWLREVREFTGLQDAEDDQIDAFWVAFEVFSRQAPSILAAPPTEPTERRERRGQATTPSFGPLGRATAGLGRRTFL
jgi:predicted phage terminase large subunit-like protein